MERLHKFINLQNDAWYKNLYKKLTKENLSLCRDFIRTHNSLDSNDFEKAVNRMFLDENIDSKASKKRRMICQELLAVIA